MEVKKSFVFRANSYVADLGISLKKGGQPVPNTKLLIGASVGDQGIPHHNFYHIEPEAIASGTEGVNRKQGTSFTFDAANQGTLPVTGNVDWAGVGDAYFAMAAIPATPSNGAEYRATKYDVPTPPFLADLSMGDA